MLLLPVSCIVGMRLGPGPRSPLGEFRPQVGRSAMSVVGVGVLPEVPAAFDFSLSSSSLRVPHVRLFSTSPMPARPVRGDE